jgi:type I restriction enzyme R subunit
VDLGLFVNGLPVATISLADDPDQTAMDLIERYKRARDPRNLLYAPGRCMAHFAVDQRQVFVCSELRGDASVFWAFHPGTSDALSASPRLFGIATDFLWREILTRPGVIDIVVNYAQNFITEDDIPAPVFPRYHQLEAVRLARRDAEQHGAGRRLLLLHGPGSGTSFSIAWLVRQLMRVEQDGIRIFDAVIVVSNRAAVERLLHDVIARFSEVTARISPVADGPDSVQSALEGNASLVLARIEGFPAILDGIEAHQRGRRFAILVDEAAEGSSSQSLEGQVNAAVQGRANLPNTSMFVFAPTAGEATLELFGEAFSDRGITRYRPFHGLDSK